MSNDTSLDTVSNFNTLVTKVNTLRSSLANILEKIKSLEKNPAPVGETVSFPEYHRRRGQDLGEDAVEDKIAAWSHRQHFATKPISIAEYTRQMFQAHALMHELEGSGTVLHPTLTVEEEMAEEEAAEMSRRGTIGA
jgi:hypothetical protein